MTASSRALRPLETERLVVRLGEPHHARAVAAFHERNRAHFGPWDPRRPEAFFTEAWWSERLTLDRRNAERDRSYRYFLFPRDVPASEEPPVLGHAHLANIVRGAFQSCHLGFALDEAHVGRGLMFEALGALIDHAFDELGLHRVEANHRPENTRSAALLERLGFVPQGYARDYLHIDGDWRDHVLTARLNPAWQAR